MKHSKNSQIVRNLGFNSGSFLIILGLNFLLTPYLIRTIGKEAYSFYPLIGTLIGYTTIITTAIGSMGGRFVTMAYYKGNIKDAQGYFNSIFITNIALSAAFSIIFFLLTLNIEYILTIPTHLINDVRWLVGIIGLSMLISICFSIFGMSAYVKNRIDLSSSRDLMASFSNVLTIIILFTTFVPRIVYVAVGALISQTVQAIINVRIFKRLLPEIHVRPTHDFSLQKVRNSTFSGIWNSINQLSNILLTQLDLLISNIFISASATGDYAIVKTVPNLIYSLLAMLSGTFTPNFNILYAKGHSRELIHEICKSMKIVCYFICLPLGFMLVYADRFFALWVPTEDSIFLYWLSVITILPMIFGSSINPIFGVFTITNKLRIPSIVLLVAGILNTLFIYLLLRFTSLGIWSIAIVGAIQQALRNLIFTPMYGAHCLGLKLSTFYPMIFKCCLALATTIVCGLIVKECIVVNNWFILFLSGICMSIPAMIINLFIILNQTERDYIFQKLKTIHSI